jgi:hypothetical protein
LDILGRFCYGSILLWEYFVMGIVKRKLRYGLLLLGISLAACERLDTAQLEAELRSEIEQGGIAIEAVTCPRRVPLGAGESFQCEVEPSLGEPFAVAVEQQDENGSLTWEIPNSKKVLNLASLETYFQREIAGETQSTPIVLCGEERYRLNRPGDRFECAVMNATITEQEEIERIIVQVNVQSDISWQQVRRSQIDTMSSASPPSVSTAPEINAETNATSPSTASPAEPANPEATPASTATSTTADEFFSDPSVFEDFD